MHVVAASSVLLALRRTPAPRVAAVSSGQLYACSWGALHPLRPELVAAPPRPGAARYRAPLLRLGTCTRPRHTSLHHTSSSSSATAVARAPTPITATGVCPGLPGGRRAGGGIRHKQPAQRGERGGGLLFALLIKNNQFNKMTECHIPSSVMVLGLLCPSCLNFK